MKGNTHFAPLALPPVVHWGWAVLGMLVGCEVIVVVVDVVVDVGAVVDEQLTAAKFRSYIMQYTLIIKMQ